MLNKKGQVAVFVIIALVIVGGIITFFVLKGNVGGNKEIPSEFAPVFDYYQKCIEQEAKVAIQLAGTQGGHIYVKNYVPGNEYAPFSSQLNFLGFPVPYWYYVSASSLIKEQVPSKPSMEKEIAQYIQEGASTCNFEPFLAQGFVIKQEAPDVKVSIEDTKVNVDVTGDLVVSKEGSSAHKSSYHSEIASKLGKFYKIALSIYSKQKEEAVFENYAVDILRLYAPVDGVEIMCSPKIWKTRGVIDDLKKAIEQNFGTIKFKGNYYNLKDEKRKYFVIDSAVDEPVNIMYSQNWPIKININGEGVDDEIMMANPVGMQQGMGVMGFCYAPYHFVYDMSFPVMIQIYSGQELFQFPVVVVVDKNVPRKAVLSNISVNSEDEPDLCKFLTQSINVNLYDNNLKKIDGNLSYECFDQQCRLGSTKNGVFVGSAPSCFNGYLVVRADGYAEKKQLFSTNKDSFADVVLDREYKENVSITIDGKVFEGMAVASFVRNDGKSTSLAYPEISEIKLSEGSYDVKVYVYGNSSVVIPSSTKTQCQQVPQTGLPGFFGATEEKCFDITIPETKIDYALIGGGTTADYFVGSELEKGRMLIDAASLPIPTSVDQLQKNFESFETKRVNINFYGNNS
ncbi:MAG: hypothetical protein Q7S74_03080 [Nanoarchaeota archaeon]|nr:hypothetical protein [Nanoarchaeota archaeon]